tara:strand:+ start:315 stop:1367 length:1053 start_codon:yes stop_codon:yes gene_type:complete
MSIVIPGIEVELLAGTELPPLDKGLISYKHLARWCAAQQNWDKVHYNQDYVRNFSGDRDLHINGAIKAQSLVQFLSSSFANLGWVWRMDTNFLSIDFAEEHLAIHGEIEDVIEVAPYVAVRVGYRIHNSDQAADNTKGTGIVLLDPDGRLLTEIDESGLPNDMGVDTSIRDVGDRVPDNFHELIGKPLDVVESVIPVDLSRLRLMADAVMNVSPWHYHPEKAAESPFGGVVAMPLYPLHGLESWPDTKPFDPDPEALGREGVTDVGRPNPTRFGMSPVGILNGGNFVQIHSLVRPGETIAAESVLAGAVFRTDHPAGPGVFIDTLNRFRTTSGRALITERQVMGYRVVKE